MTLLRVSFNDRFHVFFSKFFLFFLMISLFQAFGLHFFFVSLDSFCFTLSIVRLPRLLCFVIYSFFSDSQLYLLLFIHLRNNKINQSMSRMNRVIWTQWAQIKKKMKKRRRKKIRNLNKFKRQKHSNTCWIYSSCSFMDNLFIWQVTIER